jgi:hypothetical protein
LPTFDQPWPPPGRLEALTDVNRDAKDSERHRYSVRLGEAEGHALTIALDSKEYARFLVFKGRLLNAEPEGQVRATHRQVPLRGLCEFSIFIAVITPNHRYAPYFLGSTFIKTSFGNYLFNYMRIIHLNDAKVIQFFRKYIIIHSHDALLDLLLLYAVALTPRSTRTFIKNSVKRFVEHQRRTDPLLEEIVTHQTVIIASPAATVRDARLRTVGPSAKVSNGATTVARRSINEWPL